MTKFVVNLEDKKTKTATTSIKENVPEFGDYQKPEKISSFAKVLKIIGAILLFFIIVGVIGGYFYYRNLKTTPQYSLALLVDAARRGDQQAIDQLIDTNAVVDDFVPQITDKAVELYGRGVAPTTIQKVAAAAAPFLPAIKEKAKSELPYLIKTKTQQFEKIPFWAIAIFAERYLEIRKEGEKAFIKSKIPDRQLELVMQKNGDKWKVIAVKDEVLAQRIAQRIGQDLISNAQKNGIKKTGEKLGIPNLEDIFK